jgi:hypothetical protein
MNRIDVHSHFVPPNYRDECERTGNGQPDGMLALPVARNLLIQVQSCVLTYTSPSNGLWSHTWIL